VGSEGVTREAEIGDADVTGKVQKDVLWLKRVKRVNG
jgi:hypothetical protein